MRWWQRRHRHSHHHFRVLLIVAVDNQPRTMVILEPGKDTHMATTVTVGHNIAITIVYLDQNGNPMLTTPTNDAPPTWSQTTPATETLKVSADALSAEVDSLAVGTDAVSVSLAVGGKGFSATLNVEVDAAPQVLTSIALVGTPL